MAKKLIFIDDNRDYAEIVRGQMRNWVLDYKVVASDNLLKPEEDSEASREDFCNNIVEFVKGHADQQTEAILLDVLFDIGSTGKEEPFGYHLGKQLRAKFPEIPIILFTVRGEKEAIKDALRFNFDGYISKTDFQAWRTPRDFEAELHQAQLKRDARLQEIEEILKTHRNSSALAPKSVAENPVILHISDIHYGFDGVDPHSGSYGSTLNALVRDVKEQYAADGIPLPNLVVVSGDITNKGSVQGYELAKGFLLDLCSALTIGRDRIVLLPGNHDVSHQLSRFACRLEPYDAVCTDEGEPGEFYRYRFAPFKCFFDEFYQGRHVYRLEENRMFSIFDFREPFGTVIVAFNSCERIDHSKKWKDHPTISLDTVQAARDEMAQVGLSDPTVIKLAAWHHPQLFDQPNDPSFHHEVLTELSKAGFFLYLHGHVHKPYNNHQPDLYGKGMYEFGSGTIGAPASERPADWPKHYEILAFDRTASVGRVFSRQRIGNSWVPFVSFRGNKSEYEFSFSTARPA
jgi:3',5'-cyclic AMP phosphodiesterase CpdA/DNA-binding NarL/FixJ family response regulator